MADSISDPIDHARTTRQHAGETMKNGTNSPGLVLVAIGVVALGCRSLRTCRRKCRRRTGRYRDRRGTRFGWIELGAPRSPGGAQKRTRVARRTSQQPVPAAG